MCEIQVYQRTRKVPQIMTASTSCLLVHPLWWHTFAIRLYMGATSIGYRNIMCTEFSQSGKTRL